MSLSSHAKTALDACYSTRGTSKGMLKAKAPPSNTLEYAAWQGAMLSVNPYKASIAGLIFMTPEQRAIADEVTAYFDSLPKSQRIAAQRDRRSLEALGVW
jgi:hypothetical protein